ncbi:hypothetical protein [Desulfosporosinus sp. BG]|uniref:hypothetical protein n=1 Tax=Desulfosporosinus sp. BG TaxID=1633135 RepID=UPI00114CE939|nr:hypothetical protein [Desulfosporosinus sp. BG]
MRKKVFNNAKLLTATTLESIWAMVVSYAVGTSLSPIVHKLYFQPLVRVYHPGRLRPVHRAKPTDVGPLN